MLGDGPGLHHPGELGLLDQHQPLLHVLLAPLHPAPSPAPLLVASLIVPTFRLHIRALARGRLQVPSLRPGRSLPRGRHRRRLMIRLVDHAPRASLSVRSRGASAITIEHTAQRRRARPPIVRRVSRSDRVTGHRALEETSVVDEEVL